ncbi:MAG: YdcF family protein [Verrucomicrobia bacterium]|nr:YdcF family protein [Verrucomicrobiota bacterium]
MTEPVGAIWTLMVLTIILLLWRRQRQMALILTVPVCLLSVAGSLPLADVLIGAAEKKQALQAATVPVAATDFDCIIVLGGGHTVSRQDPLGFTIREAGDRILAGMVLAQQYPGRTLILGGSGANEHDPDVPEAVVVQQWIEQMTPESSVITNLGVCRNTYDEAVAARRLLAAHDWCRPLLVTSALHMPRSRAVFEKQGLRPLPYPCDYQVYGVPRRNRFSVIPRQGRLDFFALYLHEKIGWWVYRMKGWV